MASTQPPGCGTLLLVFLAGFALFILAGVTWSSWLGSRHGSSLPAAQPSATGRAIREEVRKEQEANQREALKTAERIRQSR